MGTGVHRVTDQLIDAISGDPTDDVIIAERRTTRRHMYDAFIAITLKHEDGGEAEKPLVLRARDISVDGIGVMSPEALLPGSTGFVQLVRSNGRTSVVNVVLRHCTQTDDSDFHCGFEFTSDPDESPKASPGS